LGALALILIAVFAPALGMAATLVLPRGAIALRTLASIGSMGLSVGCLLGVAASPPGGSLGSAEAVGVPFAPSINLDLTFMPDALGLFFALLVSGIGLLITIYARGYFGRDADSLRRFYPTLGLFATAMIGLVLSDNFLAMFLFWELTSVSSFLLIGWHRDERKSVKLAVQALVVTGMGGMLLMGGLLALGVSTGAWSFSELEAQGLSGASEGVLLAAFFLVFAGGAAKSAQWPLHFWLPGAMAAPTPVSAYLHSATMVKAGVYLFGRLFPTLRELEWWTPTLVFFGATTMLLGGYVALRSTELKRIFAYTTVSQLGLLTCMYGLGGLDYAAKHGVGHGAEHAAAHADPNIIWPVMQILNHAAYKAPLFIIAGAIMHLQHKKHLPELAGLWRTHKHLALLMILAAYAMAGLPFTLSFAAKEAFLYQIVHAAAEHPAFWLVGAMAVLTAVCNVAIFVRITRTFIGRTEPSPEVVAHEEPGAHHEDHDHSHERGLWAAGIWWPAAVFVAIQFVCGVVPAVYGLLFAGVETHALYWDRVPGVLYAITHPSMALALSGLAIAGGLALGFSGFLRRPIEDVHAKLFPAAYRLTEDTGYQVLRRLQSGSIRVYLFVVMLAFIVGLAATFASDASRMLRLPEIGSFRIAPLEMKLASAFLALLICGSAMVIPIIRRRVVRVLVLGVCGFSVTGMYLIYAAPDLALTQIMFEIISVILFLLALRLLPEERSFPIRDLVGSRIVFASVVGVAIAWIMLHAGAVADRDAIEAWELAQSQQKQQQVDGDSVAYLPAADPDGPIGDAKPKSHAPEIIAADRGRVGGWTLLNAYEGQTPDTDGRGGGGTNVVNVILVDFRGYDTVGEITVLGITVMGVLALLGSVPIRRGGTIGAQVPEPGVEDGTHAPVVTPQPQLGSSMLRIAMRLVLPVVLLFAGYVFFKGHNEPGGGFIAGLIASVGIAAYRMSAGVDGLRRLMPIKPGLLAAIGLAIALITGFAPLLLKLLTGGWDAGGIGGPFFMSDNQYIDLPGGGVYHWTSVALFDLGVFIVVVAASVGMINRFEEELEER
jgi:multicomponent K+:H+ antiporter subunit A